MSNRHVLAETTHQCHLVRVDGMDDTTCTQEETGLEHSMREQVEHTSHVTQLSVVVHQGLMTWQ